MFVYQQKLFPNEEIDPLNENVVSFIKWLKEQGIYEKFKINLEDVNNQSTNRIVADSFYSLNEAPPDSLLSWAFTWGDTPEGHWYWEEYSKLWFRKILQL